MTEPTAAKSASDWTCPRCGRSFVRKDQAHSCDRQSIDSFFGDDTKNKKFYQALERFLSSIGPIEVEATKTQVSFRARTRFAYLWFIDRVRGGTTPRLILSFGLRRRQPSPRIRESVNPSSDLWVHHMPIERLTDLDDELKAWLEEAYASANPTTDR